ncbi:MAG: hypothetical protein MJZ38_04485 [archaeon]|nr:hypothetical protein [archaeon]
MAFLFKGGDQLFNEGLDLIGRKDFSGAKKKFIDANSKGCANNNLALTYAAIIDVGSNRANIGAYRALLTQLNNLQLSSIKFGLTDIDTQDLIVECELDIKEIEAANMHDYDYMSKGQALIAVAGEYLARIGEKNLKLDEIFKGNTLSTGSREALILQAQGYSTMGRGAVHTDPKIAAEYLQMAYNFRKQLGDSGDEELRLSQEYARSCTCWICGRPANAEGIHFMGMRSTIEPVFQKMSENDAVKPISDNAERIYVCLPCYTAISNRSEDIAQIYHEKAMAEMRAMEARLQAEISSLRFSISVRR